MQVIKAPEPVNLSYEFSIFLAGSIEMGKAIDWQTEITNALSNTDVTILNPRRNDWDSSWEQKITNLQFKEQVEWELNALERSDLIVMYFDPNTKSPISLLELGLYANYKPLIGNRKLVVYCPEGFWRKGNVDVVCKYYNIPQVDSIKELIDICKKKNRL